MGICLFEVIGIYEAYWMYITCGDALSAVGFGGGRERPGKSDGAARIRCDCYRCTCAAVYGESGACHCADPAAHRGTDAGTHRSTDAGTHRGTDTGTYRGTDAGTHRGTYTGTYRSAYTGVHCGTDADSCSSAYCYRNECSGNSVG